MISIHMLGEEVIVANSAFKVLQTLKLQHHLYELKESKRMVLLDHRYNESNEEFAREKRLYSSQIQGNMFHNILIQETTKPSQKKEERVRYSVNSIKDFYEKLK